MWHLSFFIIVFCETAVWTSPPSCTSLPSRRSFMSHSSRASLGLYKESCNKTEQTLLHLRLQQLDLFLPYFTALFFSTVQSPRSCSLTSHSWMSRMKVTSTFPRLSLQPLAVRSWLTRAYSTPPPRLTALVPAALVWWERTWMMLLPGPMGPAALTALTLTAGDLSMCEWNKEENGRTKQIIQLDWDFVRAWCRGAQIKKRNKEVGHQGLLILVLLWGPDKLKSQWSGGLRFSYCFCNTVASVLCCFGVTLWVPFLIVPPYGFCSTCVDVGADWFGSPHILSFPHRATTAPSPIIKF